LSRREWSLEGAFSFLLPEQWREAFGRVLTLTEMMVRSTFLGR